MSQSYHEQFRENRRNKIQNDLFSSSKATTGGKLPAQRPTAVVKQPLRSDTFTLPKKRGETNYYVPKIDQSRNVSQRLTNKKPAILNSSSTTGQKRPTETMRKDDGGRTMLTKPTSIIDRRNLERKPVRFANESDNTYYSYSPAPTPASDSSSVYHQKSATLANPSPQDALDESRRTRVVNDAYVVHRRRDSPAYVYSNYHTVSDIPTISYATSLPSISQSIDQTGPTVIIHPKETHHSTASTIIPTRPALPSYTTPGSIIILPSSAALPCSSTSTAFLPPSIVSSHSSSTPINSDTTMTSNQSTRYNFLLPSLSNFPYIFQSVLHPAPHPNFGSNPCYNPYSSPNSNQNPSLPSSAPPVQQHTTISQSSSSSVLAPAQEKTDNRIEKNNRISTYRPNATHSSKNVTIQMKVTDEVCLFCFIFILLEKIW